MNVSTIKKVSRKSLSVFLAVLMLMTSMSVCFGTFALAATSDASGTEWNALVNALSNDTVKSANFTGSKYTYTVNDPDGKIIDAVEAWWTVFNKVKEDVGNDDSSNEFRTAVQVNDAIKAELSSKMGANYTTYNVANFLSNLITGVTATDISSDLSTLRESKTSTEYDNKSNLTSVSDIVLKVKLGGELLSYATIEDLPDSIATEKTFKISHRNTNYNKGSETRQETSGSGCNATTNDVTYYQWQYYYAISATSAVDGEKQSTKVIKDSNAILVSNSAYLNANLEEMIGYINAEADAVAAAKTAISNAKTAVVNFNQAAWTKYFSADYDAKITAMNKNIDLAGEIIPLKETAEDLTALVTAGYAGKDEAGLRELHAALTEGLAAFNGASQGAKDYITTAGFDSAAVQAFANEVLAEIQLIELRRLKTEIDNTIPAYEDYDEDQVIGGTVSGATLSTAKGTVDGFIRSLSTYSPVLVAQVMGGYAEKLSTLSDKLQYLIKTANYNDQFSVQYAKYIAEIYSATNPNASSEELVKSLTDGYDAWYTGLKTLLASIAAELEEGTADKILQERDAEMQARMETVYETLYARVKVQVDIAAELYATIKTLNGNISIINISTYSKYKQAFKTLDRATYEYLLSSPNFNMSQDTIDKYNTLREDFITLENFIATGGFSSFEQIFGEYANREVLAGDIVRDEEFVVSKDKVENVITGLDALITSGEIGELLGGLLAGEGEETADFDIAELVKGLISDMLFSDSTINMIMQELYPLILAELLKVWEKDLPTQITDPVTANISYNKTIDVIAKEAGLPLFPSDVADYLDSAKYAENIAMLKTADKKTETEKILNDNGSIKEVVVISTPWTAENPNLFNEDGTLKLTWGVDAAKAAGATTEELAEAFYQGFDDALHCLKPLLNVLVANTAWSSNQVQDVASISAKVIITINDNAHLTISAEACPGYANLIVPIFEALGGRVAGTDGALFTFSAPSKIEGYAANYASNNKLDGFETDNSAADMLRAIVDPLFGFIDTLGEAPVSTLVSILPNLCYALSMQMVPELLGTLKTKLAIGVQLSNSFLNGCVGGLLAGLLPSMDFNVADLLGDFNTELIDLSNGVNSLLGLLGLPLPEIEQGKIAQMGELGYIDSVRNSAAYKNYDNDVIWKFSGTYEKDGDGNDILDKPIYNYLGKAYHITADKGAVMNYLLQYIFGILENEEAFKGLLGLFMTKDLEDGTTAPDEEKIAETIASFNEMGLFQYGRDNAVAAIVELFNQETFTFGEYVWYEGAIYEGTTVTNLTPAMKAYLSYESDLTREKAQYIVENLNELITAIMGMVNGEDAEAFSIAATLNDLIGGFFTNETITKLAKTLSGLDINSLLAGEDEAEEDEAAEPDTIAEGEEESAAISIDVNALIKDLLGVDLTPFAAYADLADDTDWGVTDSATFIKALADVLAPFSPVIDFIFKGTDLKVIHDAATPAITLKGYNGYDSAIVPLLEALGVDAPAMGADDDALTVILNAVFSLLDTITGTDEEGNPVNAVDGILNVLPGLLYFLQSDGLTTAVNNLLIPVYAILDTIRPIYELDLNELLGSLLEDKGIAIDFNNIKLDVNFVLGLVKSLAGLDLTGLDVIIADVCKFIGVPYKSESSVIGADGMKGAYTEYFDGTDLVAVILNFALDWARDQANVDALAAIIGGEDAAKVEEIKSYVSGAYAIIGGIDPQYSAVDWDAIWPEGYDEENVILASGVSIAPTIASLDYPTDWTEESAKYLDENLDELIAAALKLAGVEGTLSDMLKEKITFFTGANLNKIVTLITDLLGKLDEEIVNAAGVLLGADLDTLRNYKVDDEAVFTTVEFAKELAKILGTIPEVVNLVFFAEDFTLFNKADGTAAVTIKGGRGYAKGLALILEALGCALPAEDTADVESVLVAVAERFDEILSDPINEILNVLPNIIYFINSNGVGTAVKNMLACVTGLTAKLNESFGVEVDLIKIINDAINGLLPEDSSIAIDVLNLNIANVFAIVEAMLGLELSAATDILATFCVGKINPYKSVSGDYGFKMEYNDVYARYDMITILVTIALMVVENEDNAAALDELLGTDIISALKAVFSSTTITYSTPDWDYCWDENGNATGNTIPVIESAITYPNDFTEEDAKYLAENLPELVDAVVALVGDDESLAALLQKNVNVFTSETLQSLISSIATLLTDVDDVLLGLGIILNVDLVGLKAHTVPEGIDTTAEFAAELANILNTYAKGVAEWLFFGRNYSFFVDETKISENVPYDASKAIITLNGAYGYAEGLALILEALGCENLPEFYDVENLDTAEVIEDVLASLAARIDEVLANPVEEVIELLPNLLYFLNANGVAAAVSNLAGAFSGLAAKLQTFGLDISLNSLVNIEKLCGIEEDLAIGLDNLSLAAILELVSELTGLDLTVLENVLAGFAMGEVTEYDSVSAEKAYKMGYKDEFDKHDMITLIVTAALITVVETEGNAEKLEEMIDTDILTAIKDVFEASEITYTVPNWNYPLASNGTVDAMKYSITYPNNWTEDTAKYITEQLPEIVDMIVPMIDGNYSTLAELLQANVNVFTAETLDSLVALIADLLGDIEDGLLEAAGVILDVDIVGLKAHPVPESIATTAEFAAELANILNTYAKGVVEWLFFGNDYTFFVKDVENGVPVDFITISGAYGYAEGLALLLEALGCKNLPEFYDVENLDTAEVIEGILASVAARIDEILANPVEGLLGLLPNLFYFLNTNGVAAVIDNTIVALTSLLDKLQAFGLEVNLNELVNLQKLMGIEDMGAKIDLDNLTMADILEAVSLMTGIDLTLIEDVLVGFALGKVEAYDSVSSYVGTPKKMFYADEFDTYDMVTVIANLAILTLADDDNAEFVKELVGEDVYTVINAYLTGNVETVPMQDIDWKLTEYADTDTVVSPITLGAKINSEFYGELYTREMGEYIEKWLPSFVDSMIVLLGVQSSDTGVNYEGLSDILNELIGTSLYTKENLQKILDLIKGLIPKAEEALPEGIFDIIVNVLKTSLNVDLTYWNDYTVADFATGDREAFVDELTRMLDPLYPVLSWLLTDENLIALFSTTECKDAIVIEGAEGYAYGIIPLLEAFDYDSEKILTPEEFKAASTDAPSMLKNILNPVLDVVDKILTDPVNEIFNVLPGVIYFLNSNGLDTVIKNTANAVFTVLENIEPITGELDIYELIGFDAENINIETLISQLIKGLEEDTGLQLTDVAIEAIKELTVGKLISFTSANGKTAYTVEYATGADRVDMVTVVLRTVLTFVSIPENVAALEAMLEGSLDGEGYKFLCSLLENFSQMAAKTDKNGNKTGMDEIMYTVYQIFYAANVAAHSTEDWLAEFNGDYSFLNQLFKTSELDFLRQIEASLGDLLNKYTGDIIDDDELAPNGLIAFFQKIIEFFQKIGDFFKNLFK